MSEVEIRKLAEDPNLPHLRIILNLPWVAEDGGYVHFWSVNPSGDYLEDCQTGREYGELALEYMVANDFLPLLTWCIMDMPKKKNFSGVEIGFLEYFGIVAISKTIGQKYAN